MTAFLNQVVASARRKIKKQWDLKNLSPVNHHHPFILWPHDRRRIRHPLPKMKTTWKDIPPVPTQQEFLDIVLSRTQRKLPTQIRSGFKISRIRGEKRTPMVVWTIRPAMLTENL